MSDNSDEQGFADLGLGDGVLRTLAQLGYEEPTPVQKESIPLLLNGQDVIGRAATGTGKTAAFALPIIERLDPKSRAVEALILTPTRELAVQVAEAVHQYGKHRRVSVLPVYGGQAIDRQLRALKRGVQVVVGTPGRLLDHIRRGTLDLAQVRFVVLDEADEMLDMGFIDDIEAILDETPDTRQTALFSATMPSRIADLARRHMRSAERVTVKSERLDTPLVRQVAYVVPRAHKLEALGRILDVEAPASAIIFCRTRNEVDQLAESLLVRGYRPEALHGGLSQSQRDRVMGRFREGAADLLVATDVAARGLDIEHVSHVINYDIPQAPEAYVHRIGRTGRAGREGVAISLIQPREHRLLRSIEKTVGQKIESARIPTVADLRARRVELFRAGLRETLVEDDYEGFRMAVESLADEFDPLDIAAAAGKLAADATRGGEMDEEVEIPHWDPNQREERGGKQGRGPRKQVDRAQNSRGDNGPMTRLFFGAGRRRGVGPGDIVGAIAGEAKIPGRVIGAIDVADQFAIVEVPEQFADRVIKAMERSSIKGRKVSVRRDRGGPRN